MGALQYKVQVEPNTIIDLINLLMIFDQLQLKGNNIRKCMIELRSNIPGFYKGLIYCSGIDEANLIYEQLLRILHEKINEIPTLILPSLSVPNIL